MGDRLERVGATAARLGSLRPADPRLRTALYSALALTIGLGVALTAAASFADLPDLDLSFEPGWLALGVVGFGGVLVWTAELWRRLLRALGPELGFLSAQSIWFVSFLGRYAPTSALVPVVRVAMAEREAVPKRICLASVVYEIGLWLTGSLVVAAYFVIELPALEGTPARWAVLLLPAVGVAALHPACFRRVANALLDRLGRESLPQVLQTRTVLGFVVAYSFNFIAAGLCVFAIARSLQPLGADDVVTVAGAYAVGTALGMVAFVIPAGLVAREAGLALALAPVMAAAPAVAVAVVCRIIQLILEVAFALLMPLLARSTPAAGRPEPAGP